MEKIKLIYPTTREIFNYWRHGITSLSVKGLEEGIIILEPLFSNKWVKEDQDFRPVAFWTKGDFQSPLSKPRIVVASAYCYHKGIHKQNLTDAILYHYLEEKIPDGIGFFKGYKCMDKRMGIREYFFDQNAISRE